MRFNFQEWLPDQPSFESPGSENIENVYPIARGFKPIPSLVEVSTNALASRAKGYYSAHAMDGSTVTYAADANYLYNYSLVTFTDISRLSSPYSTQDDDQFWEFIQFGTRLLATTFENVVQYFDIDISLKFDDLAGFPPRSRHIGVARNFVLLGNTLNSPSEVVWSGFDDSTGWTAGVNQSGSIDLHAGGWINGIVGGEVAYIIQEHQIVKMTYVGVPDVWQFDVLDQGYGCGAPYSIARIQRVAYYRGTDGFYMLDLAAGISKPIGSERVDRWFYENANHAYIKRMRGAVDPARKLVWWSFISNNAAGDLPDRVIGFQWELGRWFNASFDHELITAAFTEAITLDEIDNFFPNIDTCPISLDSDYWMGGLSQLRAFTTNHKLALFESDNLAAYVETTELEPSPGRRSMITGVRPLGDTAQATALVRSRERLSDTLGTSIQGDMQANGDISLMASGRYHRAKVIIPAGTVWTYIQGCDLDAADDGKI